MQCEAETKHQSPQQQQLLTATSNTNNKCQSSPAMQPPALPNHLSHINQRHRHHHHLARLLPGKPVAASGGGPAPGAAHSQLVIQVPTTSAAAPSSSLSHEVRAQLGAASRDQTPVSGKQQATNCHHQAATRDLRLQAGHRHRFDHLHAHLLAAGVSSDSADLERRRQQHERPEQRLRNEMNDSNSEESITPPPNYHEIPGIVPSYHGRTSGPPPAYDDVVNPHASPPTYQSLFGQVREARKSSNGLVDLLRQLFLVLIGTIGCTMIIGFLLLIPITMILVGLFYINECRAENIPSFLVVGGFVWITKNMLNCYNQFKKDSHTINRPPPPPGSRRPTSLGATSTSTTTTTLASATTSSPSTTATTATATTTTTSPVMTNHAHQLEQVVATSASAPTTTLAAGRATMMSTSNSIASPTTTSMPSQHRNQIRHPQMIGLTSYKCESLLNYFLVVWFLAGCIVVYRIYEPDYDNPLSLSYCNRTVYLYAFWLMTSAFIIMALVLSCLCCLMASSLMSCSHGR